MPFGRCSPIDSLPDRNVAAQAPRERSRFRRGRPSHEGPREPRSKGGAGRSAGHHGLGRRPPAHRSCRAKARPPSSHLRPARSVRFARAPHDGGDIRHWLTGQRLPPPRRQRRHLRLLVSPGGNDNARTRSLGLIKVKDLAQQLLLRGHGLSVPVTPAPLAWLTPVLVVHRLRESESDRLCRSS